MPLQFWSDFLELVATHVPALAAPSSHLPFYFLEHACKELVDIVDDQALIRHVQIDGQETLRFIRRQDDRGKIHRYSLFEQPLQLRAAGLLDIGDELSVLSDRRDQ